MIVILMIVSVGVLIFPFLALDARKAYDAFSQRRKAGEWMTVEEENFGMRQKENEVLFTLLSVVCLGIGLVLGFSVLE